MRKLLAPLFSGTLLAISLIISTVVFFPANAAPNSVEIISITEVSSTSVEILFKSNIPKKTLSYFVINAVDDLSAGVSKNVKKIIKIKSTGLITVKIKNLNPKAAYKFAISAKTNKGNVIRSKSVEYSSINKLLDTLSNLPANWGNPTPTPTPIAIPKPTPTPSAAPMAAPAFTLSSVTETKTAGSAITGYSISSTGGVIASYAISPTAPAGLTFNTVTGLFSGTLTTVAGATNYTITATNVTGSATATFTLTVTLAAPAFTLSSASETRTVNTVANGFTIATSTGGTISSFAINATPPGMSFNTTSGALSGTPTTVAGATNYTITATNATGSATQTFNLTVAVVIYLVGDRGPGGGIVFYVSATNFTSAGTNCETECKYLEVAPSTWQTGSVTDDTTSQWSNTTSPTSQDKFTASTESYSVDEKLNWKIGQGFYNTSVMKAAGATSAAQASVLAYGGGGFIGQWFIPSVNELNELCKFVRSQATGDPKVACKTGGTFKSTANAGTNLGGYLNDYYWSSSENNNSSARMQNFSDGNLLGFDKSLSYFVRPVRAFGP